MRLYWWRKTRRIMCFSSSKSLRRRIFPIPCVVWNGEEAINYLKGEGKYANREEYPLPDIFLLDLKMP